MKYVILFIAFTIAQQLQAQPDQIFLEPFIQIETEIHDFGEIKRTEKGEYATCTFTVQNEGNEPLIISRCKGSCGCTVPECSSKPISKGESSEVTVRYDSSRLGVFSKKVTIYSNASNEPEKVLIIKGTVID